MYMMRCVGDVVIFASVKDVVEKVTHLSTDGQSRLNKIIVFGESHQSVSDQFYIMCNLLCNPCSTWIFK